MGVRLNGSTSGYVELNAPAVAGTSSLVLPSGTQDLSSSNFGAWTAYTPTLGGTGWALGDGTITGAYCQIGKIVFFRATFTFGSTSTAGTASPTFTLPVNAVAGSLRYPVNSRFFDASASTVYVGAAHLGGATTVNVFSTSAANGATTATNSTTPFAWTTSDVIYINGTYEAA